MVRVTSDKPRWVPGPPNQSVAFRLRLAWTLLRYPRYFVLLCAPNGRAFLEPSPWCDEFTIEVDHRLRVIRLSGDFL